MGNDKLTGDARHKLPRTRVVLIIDEETGELDYFVMRGRSEVVILEQPLVAPAIYEERRKVH